MSHRKAGVHCQKGGCKITLVWHAGCNLIGQTYEERRKSRLEYIEFKRMSFWDLGSLVARTLRYSRKDAGSTPAMGARFFVVSLVFHLYF